MCNLGQGVFEKGEARGEVRGEARIIINMYKKGYTWKRLRMCPGKTRKKSELLLSRRNQF